MAADLFVRGDSAMLELVRLHVCDITKLGNRSRTQELLEFVTLNVGNGSF
jgi:hypothetical protein